MNANTHSAPDGPRPSAPLSPAAGAGEMTNLGQEVLDSVTSEIAVLDQLGIIVAVNEPWRRFALDNPVVDGEPVANTDIGVNYLDICKASAGTADAAEGELAYQGIAAVLTGQSPNFRLEYPCHSPTQKRWFSLSATPLRSGRGGAVIVHTNITERKLAEAALLESEGRYRTLVELSPEAILVHRRGQLLYVNPAAIQMFGADSAASLIATPLLDLIHADFHAVAEQRIKQIEQRGAVPPGEAKFVKLDGTTMVAEIQGALISFSGEPAIQISMRDITARRQADDLLRKLSWAVEQSTESILITDLQYRIEYVNEAFVRSTGYGREDVLGRTPHLLQSGKTPAEHYQALKQNLLQGRPWKGTFVNRRKNGSEYIEFSIITPLRHPDGHISHYVAVQEDITEKTALNDELARHRHHLEDLVKSRTDDLVKAQAAAEAANRAKSAFLANMSHEIRTPMNSVLGMAHLLLDSALTPRQRDLMLKLQESGQHLLQIIDDVLDFSKIEAGQLRLEQTDFNLAVLVQHVADLFSERAGQKGLALQVAVPDMQLRGDPLRLRQVLLNFVSNAVKFTAQGQISIRAILVAQQAKAVTVRLEVQDTGIGLTAAQIAELFVSFHQADPSTTRQYGGTGLGLAICKSLVDLMGGRIGVSSEPGQGSTFWTEIMLTEAEAVPPTASVTSGATDLHGLQILLVDDHPLNQEIAAVLLRSCGAEVDIAENGQMALDRLQQRTFDLVLMDVQMPVMDGLTATRRIRSQPSWATLPIIAMTANAWTEDRERALQAGMNDFISKPFDPERLFELILRWAHRQPHSTTPAAEVVPSASNSPVLDLHVLAKTCRDKPDEMRRIAGMFLELIAADVPKLGTAYDNARWNEVAALAHRMKAPAKMVGAQSFAEHCEQLEQLGKLAQPSAAQHEQMRLQMAALDQLTAHIEQALQRL